jgi:hypothetical protein
MPHAKGRIVVRMETIKQEDETVVVISGRLVAADLDKLKQVRGSLSGAVLLNLKDLLSADAESLVELRDWIHHGAMAQDASTYLQALLAQDSTPDKS